MIGYSDAVPIQIIVMSYLLESCARSGAGFVLARAQDLCGIRARSGAGFPIQITVFDQTGFRITPKFQRPTKQNSELPPNLAVQPNRIPDYPKISSSD